MEEFNFLKPLCKAYNFQISTFFFALLWILTNSFSYFLMKQFSCDIIKGTCKWPPRKFSFSCSTWMLLIWRVLVLCCSFQTSFQCQLPAQLFPGLYLYIRCFFLFNWSTSNLFNAVNIQTSRVTGSMSYSCKLPIKYNLSLRLKDH